MRNAGVGVEGKWKCQDFRTAFYALDSEPHGRRLLLLVQKPPDRPRLKPDSPYHAFFAVDKESAGEIVVHAGYTEIAGC